MKIAYFSPLNPQPSGISDYSEELLPYLAAQAEIDLFVDGFRPTNESIGSFRWFDYQAEPKALDSLSDYDAVVYHLGNDHRYHAGMVNVMRAHRGIVVFHDFALQDLFLGQAQDEGDMNLYLEELEACHGMVERTRAQEFLSRGSMPPQVNLPLEFPLNRRLASSAEGIIVHSKWSRERLEQIAPGVPIAQINHHITARAASTSPPAKNRSDKQVMIASFGLITRDKGVERALRALAALRVDHDFHYTLVGPAGNYPELSQLIDEYGLHDRVTITDQVSLSDFEQRIAETDIAINLRERPVGATSGSLCRIMAAGVPAIVSNVGAFSELPDDTVIKIDTDEYANPLIEAYLRRLIEDENLRHRIGENARRYVLAEHRIEVSAGSYLNFIGEVIAQRPRKKLLRSVADEVATLGLSAGNDPLLRCVASEIATLAPLSAGQVVDCISQVTENRQEDHTARSLGFDKTSTTVAGNGHSGHGTPEDHSPGRLPKIEGIDYKRAALEYPRKLDEERSYYLKTKPFYNLAHKPLKHTGDGMDPETHRHFSDFANIAVALALPPGAKILDVGCGSGWLSEYFARLGYDLTGIDISTDLIRMARERVEQLAYNVDHETPLTCRFLTHDIEVEPLPQKFDAIICYDSLHHLEDERSVFRNLASMLNVGGLLFILEGQKPDAHSDTERELQGVMREFGTLESPFAGDYLRTLLDENGFAIVGDYVSVNGLFEREMLENNSGDLQLPLRTLPTDYHYLTCMKIVENGLATSVPDSRRPGVLKARLTLRGDVPSTIEGGSKFELPVSITNSGDTLWLNGQTVRAGVVMPGVRIFNDQGSIVSEFHGHPMLPRSVAPGQSIALNIRFVAPVEPGRYAIKIDLVDQHVCWFEERGSEPIVVDFEITSGQPA